MIYFTEFQWFSSALGWTILHSIWQIAIIGSLWFLILMAFKKVSSSAKYIISIFAMLLIILMTSITFISEIRDRYPIENQKFSSSVLIDERGQGIVDQANFDEGEKIEIPNINSEEQIIEKKMTAREWLNPDFLKVLTFLWISGVLIFGIRFLLQWLGMKRLATNGVLAFEDSQILAFVKLKNQLGIKKKVQFLQSNLITSPLTFGHFKPIILLPLGMINGFPPEQIEAIILHELAHIQRNDFLVNTIQTWLEILFFYHPFVWIISKRIRTIREELCDDEVIRVNQNSMIYAASLINLQKYFLNNKNQLVMNVKGNKSELSNRIHRLFQTTPGLTKKKRNLNAYLFGLMMIMVMGGFAFSSFSNPTVSIAVDKMNVLYIAVDNPITVAVAGVSIEKMKVESDDVKLEDQGDGHFNVIPTKPGVIKIKVSAKGHAAKELAFRVKYVPDPIARLAKSTGGMITKETLWESEGVEVTLDNFVYEDASCTILEYSMVRVAKMENPVESINRGSTHTERTKNLLKLAKSGDTYYFDKVTCKCPGDAAPRKINSMVFKVK